MDPRRRTILALSLMIIIGGAGGALYFVTFQSAILAGPCLVETPFNSLPVNMSKIQTIIPLGNLNPPSHTYPTDHMYFYSNNSQGFEVFAPGDIIITRVSAITYTNASFRSSASDYSIDFQVCNFVSGRFGHVNNLSSYLWSIIEGFGEEYGDEADSWEVADDSITAFRKSVSIPVSTGTRLGIAGVGYGALDFWLKDRRVIHDFANPDHTNEYQYTICPLSYFTPELYTTLSQQVIDWWGNPPHPNGSYCGRIAYDVAGTAQGLWTISWHQDQSHLRPEDMGLALVYHNFNRSLGAISIGQIGKAWDSKVYYFNPSPDGARNREFNDVTPDGTIYWYQFYDSTQLPATPLVYDKVILLQMINTSALQIQFVDNLGVSIPEDPTSLWDTSQSVIFIR